MVFTKLEIALTSSLLGFIAILSVVYFQINALVTRPHEIWIIPRLLCELIK